MGENPSQGRQLGPDDYDYKIYDKEWSNDGNPVTVSAYMSKGTGIEFNAFSQADRVVITSGGKHLVTFPGTVEPGFTGVRTFINEGQPGILNNTIDISIYKVANASQFGFEMLNVNTYSPSYFFNFSFPALGDRR
jgi:hypothetical protein